MLLEGYSLLLKLCGYNGNRLLDYVVDVAYGEVHLHRLYGKQEVYSDLVDAVDLLADNIQVFFCLFTFHRAVFLHHLVHELEIDGDGGKRILYLMGNASSHCGHLGKALVLPELLLEAVEESHVAEDEQQSLDLANPACDADNRSLTMDRIGYLEILLHGILSGFPEFPYESHHIGIGYHLGYVYISIFLSWIKCYQICKRCVQIYDVIRSVQHQRTLYRVVQNVVSDLEIIGLGLDDTQDLLVGKLLNLARGLFDKLAHLLISFTL